MYMVSAVIQKGMETTDIAGKKGRCSYVWRSGIRCEFVSTEYGTGRWNRKKPGGGVYETDLDHYLARPQENELRYLSFVDVMSQFKKNCSVLLRQLSRVAPCTYGRTTKSYRVSTTI